MVTWIVDIELIAEWLASLDGGSRGQVVAADGHLRTLKGEGSTWP